MKNLFAIALLAVMAISCGSPKESQDQVTDAVTVEAPATDSATDTTAVAAPADSTAVAQ